MVVEVVEASMLARLPAAARGSLAYCGGNSLYYRMEQTELQTWPWKEYRLEFRASMLATEGRCPSSLPAGC